MLHVCPVFEFDKLVLLTLDRQWSGAWISRVVVQDAGESRWRPRLEPPQKQPRCPEGEKPVLRSTSDPGHS